MQLWSLLSWNLWTSKKFFGCPKCMMVRYPHLCLTKRRNRSNLWFSFSDHFKMVSDCFRIVSDRFRIAVGVFFSSFSFFCSNFKFQLARAGAWPSHLSAEPSAHALANWHLTFFMKIVSPLPRSNFSKVTFQKPKQLLVFANFSDGFGSISKCFRPFSAVRLYDCTAYGENSRAMENKNTRGLPPLS